jgi:hypothetical protein
VRRFQLHRDVDASGVSGLGVVAEGIQFSTGQCAVGWTTRVRSVAVYQSIADIEHIHGHGGQTRIVWIDKEQP